MAPRNPARPTRATSNFARASFSQPLSNRLSVSASLAYNYVTVTDSGDSSASYNQNQLQWNLNFGYAFSQRINLGLSYTFTDLLTTQVNSSYQRQSLYVNCNYTFE